MWRSNEMSRKLRGVRLWKWVAGATVLVALSALVLSGGAMPLAGGVFASHGTPWYEEGQATTSGVATTGLPAAGKEKTENPAIYAKALSKAFHNAASAVLPSVVSITNTPKMAEPPKRQKQKPSPDDEEDVPFGFRGSPFGDLFRHNPDLRRFFETPGIPQMPQGGQVSVGSGVIVDPSGVVLTNNHVVAGGGNIMVRLQDGREFEATDIKTDPDDRPGRAASEGRSNLPAARLGDSDKVEIGDWVLALGQPFDLPGTVTAGIISAKGRGLDIAQRENFLQTDAAINPGNSGGPLVNLDGEVIGINTAISSSSGGYQGVGFAIPIDLAKWVGGQLVTSGKVHRSYLGVSIQEVTQKLANKFKVKPHEGVIVAEVHPNTPAAKAGLQDGDIILKFAGKPVSDSRELQNYVEAVKPGSTHPLLVLRDGKQMTLQVKCQEMPADFGLASESGVEGPGSAEPSKFDQLGIQVENLTPALAEQLKVKADHGVAITEVKPDSPADAAGLKAGMVIAQVNRQPIKSVEDFRKALGSKSSLKKGVLLLVRSEAGSHYIVIRVDSE